jgi:hypothetical protein
MLIRVHSRDAPKGFFMGKIFKGFRIEPCIEINRGGDADFCSAARLPYCYRKPQSAMEPAPWTVNAWRKRRRATWLGVRFWLIPLVFGMIGFYIPFWLNREHVHKQELGSRTRYTLSTNGETAGQFTLGFVSFIVAGGALVAIIFAVRRHYRCPKCDEMPMNTSIKFGPSSFGVNRGVALFPATCPNCGARLR